MHWPTPLICSFPLTFGKRQPTHVLLRQIPFFLHWLLKPRGKSSSSRYGRTWAFSLTIHLKPPLPQALKPQTLINNPRKSNRRSARGKVRAFDVAKDEDDHSSFFFFCLLFHSHSSLGIHGCLRIEGEDGRNDKAESMQTFSKQKISFVFVKETVKCNILCLFLWNGSNRPISFFLCLFVSLVSSFSLFCFTNVYVSKKDQRAGWVLRSTGRLFGFCTIQMWFIF